uniref:TMV resistance protein N-like n=1 Tax=Erigeron canadensis TaxID=72917 RepID=UPI001CB92975
NNNIMASSLGSWKYDVFLSFRGKDTRKTFVGHFYSALQQHGILTYKDDVLLDRGDTIGLSLLKAIGESHILVILFSENYADSSWCLDELSQIMKCRDSETGQIVLPIFYHVDPFDVRKQKGKYGEAFAKHELSENNKNKVESWRKALFDASNIAGWEPKHVANGHESECIQDIVGSILDRLSSLDSPVEDENLVGMETRLEQLRSHLSIGLGGVRMVGIWGLGGGGKTTLAFSAYIKLRVHFHGHCFIENIREKSQQIDGLKKLQEAILSEVLKTQELLTSVKEGRCKIHSMLCRRNVLIVLDDVDHLDQLKALAGCHKWFGDGSRILITTRDHHLLTIHKVDVVSHINLLSHDEAIRLLNKHAYYEDKPVPDYEVLSKKVVKYAAGLPLALIVLGTFLHDKDKDEWLSTLARLKDHPEMDIVEKLKISYDGLKPVEKELFLDIACFNRGTKEGDAMEILDACGFYPDIGIKILKQKALITISKDGKIDMHDLVQEMAHYIVRGEHPYNPEKHSRVWQYKDIEDMCSRNATLENDKIEAIEVNLDGCSSNFILLVSNMKKLRFLNVTSPFEINYDEGTTFLSFLFERLGYYCNLAKCLSNVHMSGSPKRIKQSKTYGMELRYIDWNGYPASLFSEHFQPRKLVVLKMHLPCLKELELVGARELVRTPDFGGLPFLRKLVLVGCDSLKEIHQSLGNHSNLVYLSIIQCEKLTRFPSIVGMGKLEILRISRCKALVEFPKIKANMENLVELYLNEVGIEVLPSSLGECFTNLSSIKLEWCSKLKSIEGDFYALKCLENFHVNIYNLGSKIGIGNLTHLPLSLKKLDLSWCNLKDGEIPSNIGELSNLKELHLRCNNFTRLDFSLSRLTCLILLDLIGCENLVELPELPSSVVILHNTLSPWPRCWEGM